MSNLQEISVNLQKQVGWDFFSVLYCSGKAKSLSNIHYLPRQSVAKEIDASYKRLYAYIRKNEGKLRLFFLESKEGGTVLSNYMGMLPVQESMNIENIMARILSHSFLDLCSKILQRLDRNNDFSLAFYKNLCSDRGLLKLYFDGVGCFTQQMQRDFYGILRCGEKIFQELFSFLGKIYELVAKETSQFHPMLCQLEQDLRRRIEQEGPDFLVRFAWDQEDLMKRFHQLTKLTVYPTVYFPQGVQCVWPFSEGVIRIGCDYEKGFDLFLFYFKSLYGRMLPFSHPGRLRIVHKLSRVKYCRVEQLAHWLKMDKGTLLHHLHTLCELEFVIRSHRKGDTYYCLNREKIKSAIEMLLGYGEPELSYV